MERDIKPKFNQIVVSAIVCICSMFGLSERSGQAFADILEIRKPVITSSGPPQEELETVEGEVLIEALDGSMLFREMDGKLRILTRAEVATRTIQEVPPQSMTKEQLGESLLAELPDGFKIHITEDYVIAYQTERAYAKWIGNLYQGRLNRGFKKFWSNAVSS